MENDNHIRSVHTPLVAQEWAFSCLFFALLLLIDDAFLYALPNPWILLNPIGCLSPFLAIAAGITGIGSATTLFQKTVPGWVRIVAIVAVVLSLLSLGLYVYWFSYMNAICQQHTGACT